MVVSDTPSESIVPPRIGRERILGISFFNGTAGEAVEHLRRQGGYLVVPASPALIKLSYDEDYRRAMQNADLAIADSGLLALLWKLSTGRKLKNISGITYLKHLLDHVERQSGERVFWVLASNDGKDKAIEWLGERGIQVEGDWYVAPRPSPTQDHALLLRIEDRRPHHIVIAIPGGTQEKLAHYLREYLLYRPSIHCVGAALGFLSGDEQAIPEWADRSHLGWLMRFLAQPRMLLPRIGIAFALARMVFKYRSDLPPLRQRWVDL